MSVTSLRQGQCTDGVLSILNLFSRDTYVVDMILARVIQNTVRTLATTAMILVVIGYSFPLFVSALCPFLGLETHVHYAAYCRPSSCLVLHPRHDVRNCVALPLPTFLTVICSYYLATSRELKRLDATSRSPIFAWFSESLNGLSTIRAFNQQQLFIKNNERRVDRNQICYLPSISVNRWLAVRLEFVGATIIFVTAVLSVAALVTTGVDAGLVGFVLSYALNTTGSLVRL